MQHFYQNIQGWSDGIPEIYDLMIHLIPGPAHFVEVGAWKGKSAAYMAVAIINSGKEIKFDCVDSWEGSYAQPELLNDPLVLAGTLLGHFKDNMAPVEGHYTAVKGMSVNAAKLYEDNSLDFVFIDASHDYDNVKADIKAWYPKVKSGGYLGGHDYYGEDIRRAVIEVLGPVSDNVFSCYVQKP